MEQIPGPKIKYEPLKESTPEKPPEKPEINPVVRASKQAALAMMFEARAEFPPEIQALIEAMSVGGKSLPSKERRRFYKVRNKWWLEKFGMSFEQRFNESPKKEKKKVVPALKKEASPKPLSKREKLQLQKRELITKLHADLENLREGREVEQLQEKERRILHYDESGNRYFVLEESGPRYLGIGDILSDYAWGIKYAPDKDMPPDVARLLARKILINEVHRDVEEVRDRELRLSSSDAASAYSLPRIEQDWLLFPSTKEIPELGIIAEIICREWLNRISVNQNLNFAISRANAKENGVYKYDFKIRLLQRLRGIGIEESKEALQQDLSAIKRLGIQFTITLREDRAELKRLQIARAKEKYVKVMPVDEIVFIRIPTHEFAGAFGKWLMEGKPSGGPEQFLSQELKDDLLKKVTAGLVKLEQ